jgi:hypothetical protein
MPGLDLLPPEIQSVLRAYLCRCEAEAEQRGKAQGMAETMAVLKMFAGIFPQLQPQIPPTPQPFAVTMPAPVPGNGIAVSLSEEVPGEVADFSLDEVLDQLFGDERWSDLDRQELVRFVMAAVQEAMEARGKDPTPVLDILRELAHDRDGFEAAMAGEAELSEWLGQSEVMLGWRSRPLTYPRGKYRFYAEDTATGNRLFGEKAIEVMRRKNRDAFSFDPDSDDPAMRGLPFEGGRRTLEDHTEAYRKARENVKSLQDTLSSGQPVKPGDISEYQDYLALLTGDQLKELRGHLAASLTKRIRAGKSKTERVANIQAAMDRLKQAVATISTAVLQHAEKMGHDISAEEEREVTQEAVDDVLFEGEFDASEVFLANEGEMVDTAKPADPFVPPAGVDMSEQPAEGN